MGTPEIDVPTDAYERIAAEIDSADSPVGIDAKKTHIIIVHKLTEIERRLRSIEKRLEDVGSERG